MLSAHLQYAGTPGPNRVRGGRPAACPAAPAAAALAAALTALLLVSCGGGSSDVSTGAAEPAAAAPVPAVAVPDLPVATAPASAAPKPSESAATTPVRGVSDTAVGEPVSVEIPSIDVKSELVDLGLDDAGALEVPSDADLAGWFTGGSRPGETGPAIIAGHVDSKTGPAVFYRLRELSVGDEVLVRDEAGAEHRFLVTAREQYPKDEFPTQEVYGADPRRVLRVITCGGSFNTDIGHYRDNIVVYAELA